MEDQINYRELAKRSIVGVLSSLNSTEQGISDQEAARRLKRYGTNAVVPVRPSIITLLARQILSPLALMLFAAAALSFAAGEQVDAWVILFIFGGNALFSFFQEFHAELATKKLMHRLVPEVAVLRDGVEREIPAHELVPGDIIMLEAGDVVPADARIIQSVDAEFDEALLSGESAPVPKFGLSVKHSVRAYADASNIIFSGTSVLQGSISAVVFGTGLKTEAGEILALTAERSEPSSFEQVISKLNFFIVKITGVSLLAVFVIQLFLRSSLPIPERLLFFVALAILMIPEALPAVVAITFARGAMKLAKRSVLVRRLSAIEELGHVDVLCVDKTGTLTEGAMVVSEVRGDEVRLRNFIMPGVGRHLPHTSSGLAYDRALRDYFSILSENHAKVLATVPFDPTRRRSSRLIEFDGKRYLFVQGAPEAVLAESVKNYDGGLDRHDWLMKHRAMGESGERTLGFAYRECRADSIDADDEKNLIFLGIVGFTDPLRRTAQAAIKAAEALRVEVKILTGDSLEVAEAVARKAGLLSKHGRAVSGEEFSSASRSEKLTLVRGTSVFARVSPEQKHSIIKLIESEHKRVAFVGDGMNDAPALRAAHVGLAVSTAADISKNAADIILLKSDLHVIVEAIGYGREIFTNVKKYLFATLVGNFGNFLTVAVLSLFIPFLPLLPVQILLLNFLSDFPMISVASDNVDEEDRASPRSFSIKEIMIVTVTLGAVSSIFDFASFAIFQTLSPDRVRTLWFSVSVLTELLSIFSLRTWKPVWRSTLPSLWLTVFSCAAGLGAILLPYTGVGREYFRFSAPSAMEISVLVALAIGYFAMTEAAKLLLGRKLNHHYEAIKK